MIRLQALICVSFIKSVITKNEYCEINACQAINTIQKFVSSEMEVFNTSEATFHYELIKLERRVRSLEQPIWTISNTADRWHNCIQGACKCKPEIKSISCWNKHMAKIPASQIVPQDLRTLDLGVNSLITLNKDLFQQLPHLTELDMFNNKINYLPENIFANLWEIQYLTLHKNFLEDIYENAFADLRNLKTLDMSHNSLQVLPLRLFVGNPNLSVLHLAGNNIKELPDTLLHNLWQLEDLDVSSNKIEFLHDSVFYGLKNLKRLKMAENHIKILPLTTFQDLVSLEYLNLRKNNLAIILPQLFRSLHNLTILDLSSNQIVKVHDGLLNTKNLRELHLQQNFLYEFPENLFLEASQLEKLVLFSNTLIELKENTFKGLLNLTSLVLNNNLLRQLHPKIFIHVPKLEKLRLDSNNFLYLPSKSLDYLRKLSAIKLTKNPWHCDCNTLYLSVWINENLNKLWDSQPTCKGPGELGGAEVRDMNFDSLCHGQWASMINLSARIPVKSTFTPHV